MKTPPAQVPAAPGNCVPSGSRSQRDGPSDPARQRLRAGRQRVPAIQTARGCSSPECCRLRTVHYSDQHTTRWDVAESEVVVITAAHHPLFGQCFPVVRRLHQQGEPHVVVRLPFGATQLLPSRWTRGTPSFPTAAAAPSPAAAAWSLPSVRALVRIVGTLRERSSPQQEVLDVAADRSHDPPHVPRPALGHVHAARTPRPSGALDGPAGSTHPRPASGAQSRRVPGRTGRPAGEQQGERMPQRRTR